MKELSKNSFARLLLFGNYFYGICAVALSIEATLQQKFPIPGILFFVLVFSSTVLFYSKAYIVTDLEGHSLSERTQWYVQNKKLVVRTQWIFVSILVVSLTLVIFNSQQAISALSATEWLLIFIFPFASFFYYGVPFFGTKANLRNIGWLKPFIISFSWSGLVTVYPVLFHCIEYNISYTITVTAVLLFLKNFVFISLLCILFDIKDYAMDYNRELKTFVVNLGLRRTIYFLIVPLCLIGLGAFVVYAQMSGFSPMKIMMNTIPFLAVLIVAYSMSNRRSILYYLFVIDGLMLLKAICGSAAMIWF